MQSAEKERGPQVKQLNNEAPLPMMQLKGSVRSDTGRRPLTYVATPNPKFLNPKPSKTNQVERYLNARGSQELRSGSMSSGLRHWDRWIC